MPDLKTKQEDILDLEGQPLLADGAIFLKTLDRLLTVGSYYAADHHQYLAAVETACSALLRAIQPRAALAVEVTATGVLILDQIVDPNHLHTRKLHSLLVALNIARLEFQARLTPADLHSTLQKLKQHRIDLEKSDGFHEVAVEGLPSTVSIATRHIGKADAAGLMDDLLAEMADDFFPGDILDEGEKKENLARAFMELAEQLMANLEATIEATGEAGEAGTGTSVTHEELVTIREGLKRLLELKPEPGELLRLIQHAKMAVDLSQDPGTVDLAFKILRGEMGVAKKSSIHTNRWILEEDLSFTADALHQAVVGLEYARSPLAPALESARGDQLAVAFCLLSWDLDTREKVRTMELVPTVLKAEDCGPAEMAVMARGLHLMATGEDPKRDHWLSAVFRQVRTHQPDLLAGLWTALLAGSNEEATASLWPHLVNDLLLGFPGGADPEVGPLWGHAGEIGMGRAKKGMPCLQGLPALGTSARKPDTSELMALPLARTRPLHAVLMKSRFADHHGPQLLRALRRQPFQDWIGDLVSALGEYSPRHRKLFFALICEADLPRPTDRLKQMAGTVLVEQLEELPSSERHQEWTAEAVALLPSLLGGAARPLLQRVRRERRLLFLRAWPSACRKAAEAALAGKMNRFFREEN